MRRQYLILGGLIVTLLVWSLSPVLGVDSYIREAKTEDKTREPLVREGFLGKISPEQEKNWLERINQEAEKKRIPPVDAKVDRVWKAIPGYNGWEVDVDKTFQLVKKLPADSEIPFVYRETSPKVSLEDLGSEPIYKGNPNKPMAALMINVAWGDEFLPKMLDILNKENVHATFFFDGTWLNGHVDTAKLIGSYGHELSNHAYSHKNMSQLSRARATEEISKTERLLKEKLGVTNTWFAPPSGDFDKETVEIARELHLKTVLWTLDTVDWKNPSPDSVVKKIKTQVEPGSLILMHPTKSSSEALEGMIKEIKQKGLALGTVSEVLSPSRVPVVKATQGFLPLSSELT